MRLVKLELEISREGFVFYLVFGVFVKDGGVAFR
jgi:hypothetical protein